MLPPGAPEDGYHLSADLADRAIEFIGDLRAVDAERPFFCYFATGACHSPHHAPPEWIERYRGQFDAGWDAWRDATFAARSRRGVLPAAHAAVTAGRTGCPAWDSLKAEDQAVAARFMECFAAYLSYTDAQIGAAARRSSKRTGDLDNTLIVAVSDNGASAEGGPKGSINDGRLMNGAPAGRRELRARIDEIGGPTAHNNYPWGWTMAGNTPFKRWKREVHEGGVADPCIVSWPARLDRRRRDPPPVHARDRRACRRSSSSSASHAPAEIDGVDAVAHRRHELRVGAATTPDAPETHETQYFEMLGSRGIYHHGWKAVTFHPLGAMYDDGLDPDAPFDDDVWELYDVARRPVGDERPRRRGTRAARGDGRAVVGGGAPQRRAAARQPSAVRDPEPAADDAPGTRTIYDVLPERRAGARVGRGQRAQSLAHDHRRRSTVPDGVVPEGTLLALGLGARRLHAAARRRPPALRAQPLRRGRDVDRRATSSLHAGTARGRVRVHPDRRVHGHGRAARRRRRSWARATIAHFTPMTFSYTGGGLTCGYEVGPAIGDGYAAPFRANVDIDRVVVDVSGEPYSRPAGRVRGHHVRTVKRILQALLAATFVAVLVLGATAAGAISFGEHVIRSTSR